MNIALKMTGCRNNRYELEQILKWALANQVAVVKEEEADFCVINTCTVTGAADRKSRQMTRSTKHANPNLKTVVFGCAVKTQKEAFEKIGEADYVMNDLNAVIQFLEIQRRASKRPKHPVPKSDFFVHAHSRAMIQVQDGCDNYCAYCIIAAARGKSKSHPVDKIIYEIRKYREEGYNEVVLTGINIGAYGARETTKPEESRFADLLEELLDKTDVPRIRISSLGPEYFNDHLFDVLKNPRICRHFHLSVQSGSTSVLERMRRQYDATHAEAVIRRLKTSIPDVAVTTDFIVGFPEETDAEFNETLDFIRKNPLAKTHIFPYSLRQNTLAAKMKQVADEVKKARARTLQHLADSQREEFIESQIGKELAVLWENTPSKEKIATGLTDNYIRVYKKDRPAARSITIEKLTEDMVIWD